LGEQAKVGSVDRFQGQEAPIVFVSMCASSVDESTRGIDFFVQQKSPKRGNLTRPKFGHCGG
jgi:hypothetical protein